jgi:hypothetical protein
MGSIQGLDGVLCMVSQVSRLEFQAARRHDGVQCVGECAVRGRGGGGDDEALRRVVVEEGRGGGERGLEGGRGHSCSRGSTAAAPLAGAALSVTPAVAAEAGLWQTTLRGALQGWKQKVGRDGLFCFSKTECENPCVGFSHDAWPPQGGPVQQPHNPMLARSQALPGPHTP